VNEDVPIIDLQGVTKSFGKSGVAAPYTAVDRLDLKVDRGQPGAANRRSST
jgi:hypothetical protein